MSTPPETHPSRRIPIAAFLPSLLALLAAPAYLLLPWDPIPDRLPFGLLDEAVVLFACLIGAALLLPPELVLGAASRQAGADRSRSLVLWLDSRRSLVRFGKRSLAFLASCGPHLRRAAHAASPADFLFHLLGYRLWWRLRAPFARRRFETAAMLVIGGAPRSGTTLLRTMLGRHRLIASSAETTVFLARISSPADIAGRLGWDEAAIAAWQRQARSQAEFIDRFRQEMAARSAKPVWAEKTPRNAGRFRFVRRHFPNAKLVHMLRDGRDVVCSLRVKPFSRIDDAKAESAAAAIRCGVQWRTLTEAALGMRGYPNYVELRYEDLVQNPERELRRLMAFAGLPWDPAMLEPGHTESPDPYEPAANDPIFASSSGRWQADLSPADRHALAPLIGPTLEKLGYAPDASWSAGGTLAGQ